MSLFYCDFSLAIGFESMPLSNNISGEEENSVNVALPPCLESFMVENES
jgi:hypothetical protein